MKPGLEIGHTFAFSVEVTESMQAALEEGRVHPLYGTAAMIRHMEWAARQHILPYLEPGEEGVGYHIDVKHLSPAPIGATVTIRSTVTDVRARRITSAVEARWGEALIGQGHITQALVPIEKLYAVCPASGSAEAILEVPPPAVLASTDAASALQLEILKWETGMFPCTRYDEWLIVGMDLQTPAGGQRQEGPFLLRYEIEETIAAIRALADGENTTFQSDFLEPILFLRIESGAEGLFSVGAGIKEMKSAWQADADGLRRFAEQLEAQLAGFPSRL